MKCRLPDWAGFVWSAPLLIASILWEGVVHMSWMLLAWPIVGRRERARIAKVLQQGASAVAVAAMLILSGTSGCSTPGRNPIGLHKRPFDTGTSFTFQIRELRWTAEELFLSDPVESSQEFAADFSDMFWDPRSTESLSDDLSVLFLDHELDQFGETFSLFGW